MIDLNKDQIQELFDFSIASEAIQNAFIASAQNHTQTPPIAQLAFPASQGECCVKTGFIEGTEGFVVKVSTGFYRNPDNGLPSSNGMNLVFCAQTGAPLAILRDEGWLTDIRTGLGGALATKALAKSGFGTVLVIGTGLQARHQARCLQQLTPDRSLSFKIWGRDTAKAHSTAEDLRKHGIDAVSVIDLAEACGAAEVIITCTPSRKPLITSDWIEPGTHITALGADSPGKQELSINLITSAELLICDASSQSLQLGEFQHLPPNSRPICLGHVLNQDHPGRTNDTQITIADLTGLAVQDAAVSLAILRAANLQNTSL
ncbi:ornithine cyclodeaminase family protein [Shimia marina]|uniref:Ornithine cyclodeaminase n=1 Tax=Shimia marina TaxID=321267 RepID=A0A0P1ER64_9RHOB|nr:hypothetical protein [Shimia marina]CUH52754.1 ornithine cyclodeaminase [Shimia marina]SFD87188.1 ornithine cyclodeaminase [Shimia marina]